MRPNRPVLSFSFWMSVAFVGLVLMIWLLGSVLTPFLIAAILAYILHPACNRLVALRVPPTLATLMVMLLVILIFLALMMLILPLMYRQSAALIDMLPALGVWVENTLAPMLSSWLGTKISLDAAQIQNWIAANLAQIRSLAVSLLPTIRTGTVAVFGALANLAIIPLVMFYFLRDWTSLLARIAGLVPRRLMPVVTELATETDQVLGEFLRGQLSVMMVMSAFYGAALWLTGLDFAFSIGLIAGLLVFIPYIGMATGLMLATLAGALQFDHFAQLVSVWVVFGTGQLLEGFLVTPLLVGDRIGLHPVAVVFALMAFGQLLGFSGVLLALPLSACVLVGIRHARKRYLKSDFYRQS
ncbi:AI-2E family transporter [Leeia oryzae]|uniref:AI-2E family transporter n=1 Tax=Leeia oryzae TaxID=356662 RepID=UPI0003A2C89D|nr:AI-2E family transporter [Leeia oryzae]